MNKKLIAFLAIITLSMTLFINTSYAATHTVGKGDTLYGIAKKYNTTVANIKKLNNLKTDVVKLNQKLQVTATATVTTTTAAKTTVTPVAAKTTAVATSTTYTVQKGDTLSKIARTHGVTVANIKTWNNLKSDSIRIGQKLAVKGAAVTTVSRSTSGDTVVKTVRVSSTAYTATCGGCSGITTTGLNLKKNPSLKVIAVDPSIIPLGSKVWVEGYGYAIAGDTGGSVKGNKIDVFVPNRNDALKWGRKMVTVKVLK